MYWLNASSSSAYTTVPLQYGLLPPGIVPFSASRHVAPLPSSATVMAAAWPAQPAPMTTTSNSSSHFVSVPAAAAAVPPSPVLAEPCGAQPTMPRPAAPARATPAVFRNVRRLCSNGVLSFMMVLPVSVVLRCSFPVRAHPPALPSLPGCCDGSRASDEEHAIPPAVTAAPPKCSVLVGNARTPQNAGAGGGMLSNWENVRSGTAARKDAS